MSTGLHFNAKHTDEELLCILRDFSEKEFPTIRKFTAKNGLPSSRVYIDRFGSFQDAILLAGIEIPKSRQKYFNRTGYSREYLLKALRNEVELNISENGALLSLADIRRNETLPSLSSYLREFGSLENIYKELGYDYNDYMNEAIKKEMADKYILLYRLLGKTPTSRDIDEYSKKGFCPAMKTYESHFGSLRGLQEQCNIIPNKYGRGLSDEVLINDLIKLRNRIGRTPTQHDLDDYEDVAKASTYNSRFGSFVKALELAGMESSKHKVHITKGGTVCYSRLETLFAQMLERYRFDFIKDEPYNNWIKEFNHKHTFDFVIFFNNKPYFVEIFGIIGNDDYDETKNFKREVCRDNGIYLIELTKEDFWSKRQKDIYQDFVNKLV